jgi:ferredoxin-NADP reductase
MISARFIRREQHGALLYTFWFEPERRLRFTAGQFTELTVLHAQPDNRGQMRQFSISSSPANPHVSVTVSFPVERPSSFKQALLNLQPGDSVLLGESMGDFVLPKSSTPAIFIAGGVGITPALSIAQGLLDSNSDREIGVIHAARDTATLLGQNTFRRIARYSPLLTQSAADWTGDVGKLSARQLAHFITPDQRATHLLYVSGPERMVAHVSRDLAELGIAKQRIITDIFLGI